MSSNRAPVLGSVLAVTTGALVLSACGPAEPPAPGPAPSSVIASEVASGSASGTATSGAGSSATPQGSSGSPASSTAASSTAAASAAPAAPRAPRPASERPSATFKRPPGPNKIQWERVFATYGKLLDMDDILDDYHYRYPEKTRLTTIATTHQGRNVRALLITADPEKAHTLPSVLLNAAHHGDEPLSALIVLDAMETLLAGSSTDPRMKRLLSELAIWCVPLVNPDGFHTHLHDFGAGRKNGRATTDRDGKKLGIRNRGVDLNRNYPFRWGFLREAGSRSKSEFRSYRGPEPASEPEVKALVTLSDREHFVASLSYHTGTVALLAPYTIDGVPSPQPNEAWLVAEHVARGLPGTGDRPLYVLRNLYPVDGTDQDYHRGAHGTLALLFEASARDWEDPPKVKQTLEGVRPAWSRLFDRYLDGPSVEGHVHDAAGKPITADVQVVEVKTRAGESWKTRCPDGFFGRYLPEHGKYTIRVTPTGGAPIDTAVEVTEAKGRVSVDIVVPAGAQGVCPAGE